MIQKWRRLIELDSKARKANLIQIKDDNESASILAWFQKNYPTIDSELKEQIKVDFHVAGQVYRNVDPIAQLVMSFGSLREIGAHPFQDDIIHWFRIGRSCLNSFLGVLTARKERVGDIVVAEYETLKEFYENHKIRTELISKRKEKVDEIKISFKKFTIAGDYFDEATSCFTHGFFRGSTILAISALESAVKADNYNREGEEWGGRFLNLLNRYFGDLRRLPHQYQDFSNTYVKVRNSITHPEKFNFSETLVYSTLVHVAEMISHLEKNA